MIAVIANLCCSFNPMRLQQYLMSYPNPATVLLGSMASFSHWNEFGVKNAKYNDPFIGVYPVGCSVQSSKRPRASCCFKRTISLDPVIQSSFGKTETEDGRRKRAHSQKGSTPDRIANISSNRWDEKGIRRRSYTIAGDRSPQGNFLRHFASVRRIASCMTRTKQEQMEEPLKWYSPCRISLCQSIESCTSRGSLTKRANANLSTLACHPIKRVSKRVTQPENVVYSEGIPTISRMLEILTP